MILGKGFAHGRKLCCFVKSSTTSHMTGSKVGLSFFGGGGGGGAASYLNSLFGLHVLLKIEVL